MTTKRTNEERLGRLETGYEHLATKADVAKLRGELQPSITKLLAEIKTCDAQSKARYTEIMGLITGINIRVAALQREMAAK